MNILDALKKHLLLNILITEHISRENEDKLNLYLNNFLLDNNLAVFRPYVAEYMHIILLRFCNALINTRRISKDSDMFRINGKFTPLLIAHAFIISTKILIDCEILKTNRALIDLVKALNSDLELFTKTECTLLMQIDFNLNMPEFYFDRIYLSSADKLLVSLSDDEKNFLDCANILVELRKQFQINKTEKNLNNEEYFTLKSVETLCYEKLYNEIIIKNDMEKKEKLDLLYFAIKSNLFEKSKKINIFVIQIFIDFLKSHTLNYSRPIFQQFIDLHKFSMPHEIYGSPKHMTDLHNLALIKLQEYVLGINNFGKQVKVLIAASKEYLFNYLDDSPKTTFLRLKTLLLPITKKRSPTSCSSHKKIAGDHNPNLQFRSAFFKDRTAKLDYLDLNYHIRQFNH